jgi:hypothetical protein
MVESDMPVLSLRLIGARKLVSVVLNLADCEQLKLMVWSAILSFQLTSSVAQHTEWPGIADGERVLVQPGGRSGQRRESTFYDPSHDVSSPYDT